ncbi:hypothetical protein FGB62_281g011 [Gracilaria domingensis]|nr:hypothetical protein FGB62_281g011 [Gracilaria domingensis]
MTRKRVETVTQRASQARRTGFQQSPSQSQRNRSEPNNLTVRGASLRGPQNSQNTTPTASTNRARDDQGIRATLSRTIHEDDLPVLSSFRHARQHGSRLGIEQIQNVTGVDGERGNVRQCPPDAAQEHVSGCRTLSEEPRQPQSGNVSRQPPTVVRRSAIVDAIESFSKTNREHLSKIYETLDIFCNLSRQSSNRYINEISQLRVELQQLKEETNRNVNKGFQAILNKLEKPLSSPTGNNTGAEKLQMVRLITFVLDSRCELI